MLPIREAPYQAASLKKIKEEIADKAGVAESEVAERLNKAYSAKETALYDRLCKLFMAMDKGDPILNVPTYNGGLFNTHARTSRSGRDQRIARFLLEHKVPDRYLALAIDRLARDQDERTLALVFIDYKSLEVRHLGSIYEGLLEFKLKVAEEDLTTQTDKKGEKYIPLSQAKAKRGKQAEVVVEKKEVYLSNDKAERKASGSYYTPDPIVEYIVAHTVGPVLEEKLEALRPEFRKVRKTFDNELQKSQAYPSKDVTSGKMDHRQWAGLQTYNAHKDLVERLFDLRVLDPAMGSGHFLVEVVDSVTDRLLKFLNQFPINPVNFALDRTRQSILESLGEQGVTVDPDKLTDINLLKRHVLKRCIYGVDLNPMAVELAKVSLVARRLHAGCAAQLPRPPPALRQFTGRGDVQGPGRGHDGDAVRPELRAAAAGHQPRPVRQQDGRRHGCRGRHVGQSVRPGPAIPGRIPDRSRPARRRAFRGAPGEASGCDG